MFLLQTTVFSVCFLRKDDSLSQRELRKLRNIKQIIKINGRVIDPVTGDLKLSIPKINAIPEI